MQGISKTLVIGETFKYVYFKFIIMGVHAFDLLAATVRGMS